ncbi:hypothetical protein Q2K19_21150 [Micromonospora soli]|uniref:hypothetical protein n=1 Tax=Micromonospora sp. NBRC 110009 TaxID=3061627 RepID=UPI002671C166|nr:hypothetical protein [Micromonospora sp. NBRC 110009]WKT96702.1 hypothetical protein Q2K19_21150 [Micromonospora sp. NBRC 110009]
MGNSFWETQFVLSPPAAAIERHDQVDLHLPSGDGRRPAVLLVHGVPLPPGAPDPREWLLYRGYGALLAEQGVVAATPRLPLLHTPADLAAAAAQLVAAVDLVRADPRVDPERLALWFFSGSGLLLGDWLRDPPRWLRALAATYPLFAPLPGWAVEPRFRPLDVLAEAGAAPPLVLTRAGQERPEVAAGTEAFLAEAARRGTRVRVVDVPDGRHGFDALDHTDQSRAAVRTARDEVLRLLNAP